MALRSEEIQQIIAYINGKVPEEALEAFHQKLAINPAFKETLETYELLFQGFKGLRMETFLNNLPQTSLSLTENGGTTHHPDNDDLNSISLNEETIEKDLQLGLKGLQIEAFEEKIKTWSPKPPQAKPKILSLKKKPILAIAASILLLITMSIGYQYFLSDRSFDQLNQFITQSYIPPISAVKRSASNEPKQTKLSKIQTEILTKYELGHSNYQAEKYEVSLALFQAIIALPASKSIINIDNARWTTILCHLGIYLNAPTNGNLKQLKNSLSDQLDLMENPKDIYYQKALELKKMLKN